MKLVTWNVNGLRAVWHKGFPDFLRKEDPDIVCLQEVKASHGDILPMLEVLTEYDCFSSCAQRQGYSGTACLVKKHLQAQRIGDCELLAPHTQRQREFHREGRINVVRLPRFDLYNLYVPCGSSGEERLRFKLQFLRYVLRYLQSLSAAQLKRTLLCGDFNICHRAIDIHHPKLAASRGMSGFLPAERRWVDSLLTLDFLDTFRLVHGDIAHQYSWWPFRRGAREANKGWRIDYVFIPSGQANGLKQAAILKHITGSDHCPMRVELQD